jgi:hypothetical protein
VQLGNGEHGAHNISPHHVFVTKDFKVVGADDWSPRAVPCLRESSAGA